jgi:integrase/recombinase XerD
LLERFIAWCAAQQIERPSAVNRRVLEAYRQHIYTARKRDGEPLTFASQAQLLIPVRAFFRWLARQEHIAFNPASELELPKVEKRLPAAVLTSAEAEQLMNAPRVRTPLGLRDRAILEVLYSTGIRRVELVRLKLHDVDWPRSTVMVRQGKGRKDRVVPLGERARAWLRAYCDRARPRLLSGRDRSALFLHHTGAPLEPRRLTESVRRYIEQAGIEKPGACHLLRHTAATLMLEGGADVRYIQALLGHESLETTAIYTRVSIAKLAEVHAATHPGARLPRSGRHGARVQVSLAG